jgi:hypothetical protein
LGEYFDPRGRLYRENGENYIAITKYSYNFKMKQNEMDRPCSTHGELQVFNWISEGKISSEVLVVDGRIIKRIKI